MKFQILFSGKNKKNISKCHLLKFLPRVLRVKGVKIIYACFRNVSARIYIIWAAPCINVFLADIEGSGDPAFPCSLIRAFGVRLHWTL